MEVDEGGFPCLPSAHPYQLCRPGLAAALYHAMLHAVCALPCNVLACLCRS
jgi:hypothetical protein